MRSASLHPTRARYDAIAPTEGSSNHDGSRPNGATCTFATSGKPDRSSDAVYAAVADERVELPQRLSGTDESRTKRMTKEQHVAAVKTGHATAIGLLQAARGRDHRPMGGMNDIPLAALHGIRDELLDRRQLTKLKHVAR